MPRAYEDYLRDIVAAARHIESETQGLTKAQFQANDNLLRLIGFDLILIGEASNHIPEEIRARVPDVEWPLIVAMRNRIVHGYWEIDLPTVWKVTQVFVPHLRARIEALLQSLHTNED